MGISLTGGQAAPTTALPTENLIPSVLIGWRRGLNNMLNGVRPAKLLCVGDSLTRGYGQGVDAVGFPADLVACLVGTRGFNAAKGLVIPEFQKVAQTADPRITYGTGWSVNHINAFMWGGAGPYWTAPSGAAGVLTFTPGTSCNKFDVYYWQEPGTSGFTITPTGVAGTIVPGGAVAGISKVTVTAAALASNNTVTIGTITAGSGAFIIGIEAYNANVPQVVVGNCGVNGSTAASWVNAANAPTGPMDCIKAYAPDLTLIMLGANDANFLISPAQFLANLQTLTVACAANGGSVIWLTTLPQQSTDAGYQLLSQYQQIQLAAAASSNVGIIDLFTRMGGVNGWAQYNALGWFFDGVHLDQVGYQDIATTIATVLLTI